MLSRDEYKQKMSQFKTSPDIDICAVFSERLNSCNEEEYEDIEKLLSDPSVSIAEKYTLIVNSKEFNEIDNIMVRAKK